MTREEARTALGDRNNLLWGMSKEEKKYYSEALDMAISALSAIEDIKAEIAKIEIPKDVKTVDGSFAFCQALEIADLAIDRVVDKHISEKEYPPFLSKYEGEWISGKDQK